MHMTHKAVATQVFSPLDGRIYIHLLLFVAFGLQVDAEVKVL